MGTKRIDQHLRLVFFVHLVVFLFFSAKGTKDHKGLNDYLYNHTLDTVF